MFPFPLDFRRFRPKPQGPGPSAVQSGKGEHDSNEAVSTADSAAEPEGGPVLTRKVLMERVQAITHRQAQGRA